MVSFVLSARRIVEAGKMDVFVLCLALLAGGNVVFRYHPDPSYRLLALAVMAGAAVGIAVSILFALLPV